MAFDPNSDYARMKPVPDEVLARERLIDDTEPRHEWRKQNRLELLIGGAIAVLFLGFLVLLFLA